MLNNMNRFAVIILLLTMFGYADQHALLVGVTRYPNQPIETWLKGPEHDVKLMRHLLQKAPFEVPEDHIICLSGWPKQKDQRPTKKNILQSVAMLTDRAQKGDLVVISMSGHGSQQPADPSLQDLEPDGFDEIFLPADAGEWDNVLMTVENAITDDEVQSWIRQLLDKEVFLWIIFDSCHSGTMTRGFATRNRQYRRIDPAQLIPEDALHKAEVRIRGSNIKSRDNMMDVPVDAGLVAMYAAQSFEPTFEIPLPEQTSPRHGIFTYMLADILSAAEEPMTYRELVDHVTTAYRCMGIMSPMPLIEGAAADRIIGNPDKNAVRRDMRLGMTPQGEFIVDHGALHGIRKGCILQLLMPAGISETKPLGYVKVTKAEALTSIVTPVAYNNTPLPDKETLAPGLRCRMEEMHFGLQAMKVGIMPDVAERKILQSVLDETIKAAPQLLTGVSAGEDADWLIDVKDGMMCLMPAAGWIRLAEESEGEAPHIKSCFNIGKVSAKDTMNLQLHAALMRVARARQLLHVASSPALTKRGQQGIAVHVDIIQYPDYGSVSGRVVDFKNKGRLLKNGDIVAFRMKNTNTYPIDITLLFVDSSYGITALFPEPGTVDDNRLMPGQTLETDRLEVTSDTVGPEQIVALAIRSGLTRQDFACLEQESLGALRGTASLATPLGQLLQSTMYGKGETRGLSRVRLAEYGATILPWITQP